jgi:Asp-tRNA(Asn)/Glu-tRNA(Gln) amidotransferase A subunit family amidase
MNIHDKTIAELAQGLKNKEFSSVELTQHYLDRINASDLNACGVHYIANPLKTRVSRNVLIDIIFTPICFYFR